eukprot:CAMPEP_0181340988 /NCGR_PEP_ID=MMETSP1101-20121128/30152_1 /TAXON_ID=46948 /ORGANISM="Rhodomonas abbreviata, Strain Caron Lab Isolate" /LENGTH=429 /DNA_ID=CAMNT_0023452199 /DNA_START=171 /DNA_END=1461 /DNA_ORIENTATION=-
MLNSFVAASVHSGPAGHASVDVPSGGFSADAFLAAIVDLFPVYCAMERAQQPDSTSKRVFITALVEDKVVRKEKWNARGIAKEYLVPTLYSTYVTTTKVYDSEALFHQDDGSGELCLAWDDGRFHHCPLDSNCEATLKKLLLSQGSFVLKPIEGNRAEGVMLVSVQGADALAEDDEFDVAVRKHTSEARLVDKVVETESFTQWFNSCVVENPHVKTGILVEPMVEWDNEVTCISIAGGKLIVVGSKGGGLVRSGFAEAATRGAHNPVDPIVLVSGKPPLRILQGDVHDARREKYQLRTGGICDTSPADFLIHGCDQSGRRMWEVIRDTIQVVTAQVSITRVDFFVKYPVCRAEQKEPDKNLGKVLLNEVEHGFDASLFPSWFGMQMAELISKAWVLLGASHQDRTNYVNAHAASEAHAPAHYGTDASLR